MADARWCLPAFPLPRGGGRRLAEQLRQGAQLVPREVAELPSLLASSLFQDRLCNSARRWWLGRNNVISSSSYITLTRANGNTFCMIFELNSLRRVVVSQWISLNFKVDTSES